MNRLDAMQNTRRQDTRLLGLLSSLLLLGAGEGAFGR